MTFNFAPILDIIRKQKVRQMTDDIMKTLTQDLDQETRKEIADLKFVQKLFNDDILKVDHEYVAKTMIFDLISLTYEQNNPEILSEIKNTITCMIEKGVDLNVKDQHQHTPLDFAIPGLSQSSGAKNIDALKDVIIAMINKGVDLTAPLGSAIFELSNCRHAEAIHAFKEVIIAMIKKGVDLNAPLKSAIVLLSQSSDAKNIEALKDVIIAMINKDVDLNAQLESMISRLSQSSDAKNIEALKEISSLIKQEAITNFKSKLLDCKDEDAIKLLKKLMESKEEVKKPYIEKLKSDQYLMWKISNFNFNDESIKTSIDDAFPEDSADLPFYTKAWYNIYYFFAEFLYHLVVDYPEKPEFTFDATGHSEITD